MKLTAYIALALLLSHRAVGQTEEKERPAGRSTMQKSVRFYPNPASEVIHFESRQSSQQPVQLRIFNFLGKKILEVPRVEKPTRIDLSGFGRGLYLYQVVNTRGQIVESGKFHVEK